METDEPREHEIRRAKLKFRGLEMRFSLTIFLIIAVSFRSGNGQSNSYGSKQSYLESITKGSEYNCMKTCVPQDRKIFVDENYFFGPDPRPTANCDKDNDRAIDVNLCRMNPALTGNLSYISGAMFFFPNMTTTSKLSWHAALKACRNNLGLQMASISDEKENNAFAKFLMENKAALNMQKDSFWTSGANFFGDDFTWMETGDRVVYTNWAGGKLSGGGKCIQISLAGGKMVWKDADCSTESRVVCEVMDECYKSTCDTSATKK